MRKREIIVMIGTITTVVSLVAVDGTELEEELIV